MNGTETAVQPRVEKCWSTPHSKPGRIQMDQRHKCKKETTKGPDETYFVGQKFLPGICQEGIELLGSKPTSKSEVQGTTWTSKGET